MNIAGDERMGCKDLSPASESGRFVEMGYEKLLLPPHWIGPDSGDHGKFLLLPPPPHWIGPASGDHGKCLLIPPSPQSVVVPLLDYPLRIRPWAWKSRPRKAACKVQISQGPQSELMYVTQYVFCILFGRIHKVTNHEGGSGPSRLHTGGATFIHTCTFIHCKPWGFYGTTVVQEITQKRMVTIATPLLACHFARFNATGNTPIATSCSIATPWQSLNRLPIGYWVESVTIVYSE